MRVVQVGFLFLFLLAVPLPSRNHPRKIDLPPQDQPCLACHGQPGMKSEKGKDISIDPAKHAASAHGALTCRGCHVSIRDYPHPARIAPVKCSTCHAEVAASVPKSAHGALGEEACLTCHGNIHEVKPGKPPGLSTCAQCHASEIKELEESVHGKAAAAGDHDAPTCESCHGPIHQIAPAGSPESRVAKRNGANTCATCHSDPGFLSRHKIPIAHPVEFYKQSVHARAVAEGKDAATCSDCHGTHAIYPARDSRSKVNHWNVAETCGACHAEIAKTYMESIHGQALKAGVSGTPVCTDCHGEHLILAPQNPASPVSAARVSIDTCGRCHGDQRLNARFNLPPDRVPSYADSFHGLAIRGGSQTVANCASCHGVHNIFPSSDPRSTVNPANLAATCGRCHPGAGASYSIGPVHVQITQGEASPVVLWIRRIYLVLIPLTLGFMVLHNLLDLFFKMRNRRAHPHSGETVERMNLWFRIAHWGVMLSFPTLVYSGFALKFPGEWWSRPLLLWEGHIAFRGWLHRVAAVVLLAATVYHLIHLSVNRRDRVFLKAMLPGWKDVTDLLHKIQYNLGLRPDEPTFGKFNYAEKLEYWAFLWGTFIMALSGFLLWFNNFTLRHFAKWTTDAATAVHYYEAILATFSILLWHFYIVIFDPVVYPMDTAWLDGKVPAEHYRHSRPQYLKLLEERRRQESLAKEAREKKVREEKEKTAGETKGRTE